VEGEENEKAGRKTGNKNGEELNTDSKGSEKRKF
jgi:hypothetical protein